MAETGSALRTVLLIAFAAAVLFAGLASRGTVNPATPLTRLTWPAASSAHGGFSGLALLPGDGQMLALTDRGLLVQARLERDSAGRLTGARIVTSTPLADRTGAPFQGFDADAETIRLDRDGTLLVGFEAKTRIERFLPPDGQRQPLHPWDALRAHWGNRGIEALVPQPGGALAILEAPQAGTYITLILSDGQWRDGTPLATDGAFMAVDAVLGVDGGLYLLERAFSLVRGYRNRISLYPPQREGYGPPRPLLSTQWSGSDNLEGVDLWRRHDGRLIATLISDNNFNPLTPTVIAEYELGPSPLQAPGP